MSDYIVYHDSYTSAVREAEWQVENAGYTMNPEETAQVVGLDSRRPKGGQTTKYSIQLYKNGEPAGKMIHVQVYNRETEINPFELNMYYSPLKKAQYIHYEDFKLKSEDTMKKGKETIIKLTKDHFIEGQIIEAGTQVKVQLAEASGILSKEAFTRQMEQLLAIWTPYFPNVSIDIYDDVSIEVYECEFKTEYYEEADLSVSYEYGEYSTLERYAINQEHTTVYVDDLRYITNHFNRVAKLGSQLDPDTSIVPTAQTLESVNTSEKPIQEGLDGEWAEVVQDGYPLFLQKVGGSHVHFSNNLERGFYTTWHVAQFKNQKELYKDLIKWLSGEIDITGRIYD